MTSIICFSHLRWDFVYQRPQHLMKRAADNFRVYYFEEPVLNPEEDGYSLTYTPEQVKVVVPHLQESHSGSITQRLEKIIASLLLAEEVSDYLFWYYTPMMLQISEKFQPQLVIYDCMDQLSAFKNASPHLEDEERRLLQKADVVFTGGMSLYNSKKHLHENIRCFPSSIDFNHFAKARLSLPDPKDQQPIPYPRLGFFGVVDERFDIELLDAAASSNPDYHYVIIGPVVKIDPATLPVKNNIHYLGMKSYEELPKYISNWDVALLLFALNESTKFISPTKTPEYLAAGLPVISTAIEDVVSTYGDTGLATIVNNSQELIAAATILLDAKDDKERLQEVDEFLRYSSWDNTWKEMYSIIEKTLYKKQKQPLAYV